MSFPGYKRLGIDVDATSTVQEHELGLIHQSNTGQVFRYVKAGESITAYQPVDWVAAYTASVCDAGDLAMGVAQVAIASASYGWVLEKGLGVVLGEGSLVAGPIAAHTTAGGLVNAPVEAVAGDGPRGITYAAEASVPAGVAVFLF